MCGTADADGRANRFCESHNDTRTNENHCRANGGAFVFTHTDECVADRFT